MSHKAAPTPGNHEFHEAHETAVFVTFVQFVVSAARHAPFERRRRSSRVAFVRSPARFPERTPTPDDPRFLDLFVPQALGADLLLAGTPYDGAVIGRKGCRDGPTAIREAFRWLGGWDPGAGGIGGGRSLKGLRIHDLGDVPPVEGDTRATHEAVQAHLGKAISGKQPLVVLGGDNSLSYATFRALHEAHGGRWGVVVLDAHYDLRPVEGQPSSGTPYRRILTEVVGRPVKGPNLVEVGIRPYANAPSLAAFAREHGVRVLPVSEVRRRGMPEVAEEAVAQAGDGADHLFLSVDIDGLDQSIAPGCSAPGAGGLTFDEARVLVEAVAADRRCRGMDVVEVAPNLDPTGNTARVAAQLVAHFAGALHARR
jgi:formiminoglutamase/agmatinase